MVSAKLSETMLLLRLELPWAIQQSTEWCRNTECESGQKTGELAGVQQVLTMHLTATGTNNDQ